MEVEILENYIRFNYLKNMYKHVSKINFLSPEDPVSLLNRSAVYASCECSLGYVNQTKRNFKLC